MFSPPTTLSSLFKLPIVPAFASRFPLLSFSSSLRVAAPSPRQRKKGKRGRVRLNVGYFSSLWQRLVSMSSRNIGQVNKRSIAVRSTLPSILSNILYSADPDLRQDPAFPRCCLPKLSLQEFVPLLPLPNKI